VFNLVKDLRYGARKRVLGIDATCINQTDEHCQVPQMRQIYQRAHAAIIWLPLNVDEDRAVTTLVAVRWLI